MKNPKVLSKINILLLPTVLLYLEIIVRLHFRMNNAYMPIIILFSLCYGFFLEFICRVFNDRIFRIVNLVFLFILTLLYSVELIAKQILQTFYQPSVLGVAAENHLTDYTEVVTASLKANFLTVFLLWLPFVLAAVFNKKLFGLGRKSGSKSLDKEIFDLSSPSKTEPLQLIRDLFVSKKNNYLPVLCLVLTTLFYLAAVVSVKVDWSGDIVPKELYRTNTMVDDQVEQLGLATMVRLDILYTVFPPDDVFNSEYGSADFAPPAIDATDLITQRKSEKPQVLNVDLEALASSSDPRVAWLSNHFLNTAPTMTNDYTGIFEGYNIITIVAEGMSGYGISEKYTPTLYRLTTEGYNFRNFYTTLHFTSTSNGECQTLLGLYPKLSMPITMSRTGVLGTNTYFSLPTQLARLGYSNYGYHNNVDMYDRNDSHTNMGYDWKYCGRGLASETDSSGSLIWPQRDKFMIDNTVQEYVNGTSPFNVYYLTISGHTPYSWNYATAQYEELFADSTYSDETNAYIATLVELDRAVESLIESLRAAGRLDKTLIVLTPDHIPYNSVNLLQELAGKSFYNSNSLSSINESEIDFDVYKSSLIIWTPGAKHTVVDKVCCQVDILPTVSNLLGLKYDSRMLAGRDIFSEQEGLVVFSSRSWKSDRGLYHRYTQTFSPSAAGLAMTDDEMTSYVEQMKILVENRLDMTERIVESDFYDYIDSHLLPEAKDIEGDLPETALPE